MNWTLWLEGLLSAAATGAGTAFAQAAADGKITKGTGVAAGVGAILGVLGYLKQPAFVPPAPPAK